MNGPRRSGAPFPGSASRRGAPSSVCWARRPRTKPERVGRPVDRNVAAARKERKRADVVFVAVREEDGVDRAALVEEFHVGDDDVHTQVLGAGEHHPGVDDETVAAVAVDHQVHAEFAEAA